MKTPLIPVICKKILKKNQNNVKYGKKIKFKNESFENPTSKSVIFLRQIFYVYQYQLQVIHSVKQVC